MTQRPLDVAIEGDGFFQVQRPDGGTAYTRDGSLTLSESGALVTNGGYLVLPGVTVPRDATSVTIAPNGVVSATTAGSEPIEIGRIELARFLNPNGLLSIGENQYVATPASGEPIAGLAQDEGFGRLLQGSLESSNVEIVQEMTDMIAAQRAYEINAKAIRAGEEMMQLIHDLIR
jgi:flagellar basal-body rod protein FlgG